MNVMLPVNADGTVELRFGRAHFVAVAEFDGDQLTNWTVDEVNWDVLHDEGTHGHHHARMVRYIKEHNVERIGFVGMGQSMMNTLNKANVLLFQIDAGDNARQMAQTIATYPVEQ